MSFTFTPITEEEALNLLPAGEYNFQVKAAENATSKKGNPMIKLTLIIWDNAGKERYITDYLMPQLMYKVRHFCYAIGLQDKYELGKFDAVDCIDKAGKCKLKIEESDGYPPKNAVQDYVKKSVSEPEAKNDFIDSDIPF